MAKLLIKSMLLLLCMMALPAQAQHYGGSLAYGRVSIPQWNRAIEVYNFSRPYLLEPLETYSSNIHLQGYWLQRPYEKVSLGPMINYTRNCLNGKAPNLRVDVHVQRLELDALVRLRKVAFKKELNSFFMDLSPGIHLAYLTRRHNGKAIFTVSDEAILKRVRSLGIGIGLGFKIGYSLYFSRQLLVSPFALIKYTPLMYAKNSINVLNQLTMDGLRDHSMVYDFRVGIEVSFCWAVED